MPLWKKYKIEHTAKKLKTYSVHQIVSGDYVEIGVDITIKTYIKIDNNKCGILIGEKKLKEILIVEKMCHITW